MKRYSICLNHSKYLQICLLTPKNMEKLKKKQKLEAQTRINFESLRHVTWVVARHVLSKARRRIIVCRRRNERIRRHINILIVNIVLMLLLLMMGRLRVNLIFTVVLRLLRLLTEDWLRVIVLVLLIWSTALINRLVAWPIVIVLWRRHRLLWLLCRWLILWFIWRNAGSKLGKKSSAFRRGILKKGNLVEWFIALDRNLTWTWCAEAGNRCDGFGLSINSLLGFSLSRHLRSGSVKLNVTWCELFLPFQRCHCWCMLLFHCLWLHRKSRTCYYCPPFQALALTAASCMWCSREHEKTYQNLLPTIPYPAILFGTISRKLTSKSKCRDD